MSEEYGFEMSSDEKLNEVLDEMGGEGLLADVPFSSSGDVVNAFTLGNDENEGGGEVAPDEDEVVENDAIESVCAKYALNRQQYDFCVAVCEGLFDADAYVRAYWANKAVVKKNVASAAASRLRSSVPGVNEYINVLRAEVMKRDVMSMAEKRQLLTEIARGAASAESREMLFKVLPTHRERMQAIDLDNKMAGDYAVEKSEVNLQGDFVGELFKIARTGFAVDEQLNVPEVQVQDGGKLDEVAVCEARMLDDGCEGDVF